MVNYNKNFFVGIGGVEGINESYYIGVVYGMEWMMGCVDIFLCCILDEVERQFCLYFLIFYVFIVVGRDMVDDYVICGFYIGDDCECFL